MKNRVTVSMDAELLRQLDDWVGEGRRYGNRSEAMQEALVSFLQRGRDEAYERALGQISETDVREMQAMADEGLRDYVEGLEEHPW